MFQKFFLIFLLICIAVLSSCIGPKASIMTPTEIDQYGSFTYQHTQKHMFKLVIAALRAQGYEIAFSSEKKGLIKTKRKMIRMVRHQNQAVAMTRQYTVTFKNIPGDKVQTKISFDPLLFMGTRDLTKDKVWVLDGPEGERALWSAIFNEIKSIL